MSSHDASAHTGKDAVFEGGFPVVDLEAGGALELG